MDGTRVFFLIRVTISLAVQKLIEPPNKIDPKITFYKSLHFYITQLIRLRPCKKNERA